MMCVQRAGRTIYKNQNGMGEKKKNNDKSNIPTRKRANIVYFHCRSLIYKGVFFFLL